VVTNFPIHGDFEITVGFEILQEPEPARAGKPQTRFTMGVGLDRPGVNSATLSRAWSQAARPSFSRG